MVIKDSGQVDEKEIRGPNTVTQHLGEDHTPEKPIKAVFPGNKQLKHVIAGGVAGAVSRTCVSGPCTFRPFNIFGLLFLDEEQKTVKSIPCLVFLP